MDISGFDEALTFQKSADPTELIKAAMEPAEVYVAGRKAVAAYFKVFDSSLPALDELLVTRINALETLRNTKFALVLLCVAAGLYLFLCFSKAMAGALKEVALHLDRMAEGDLRHTPQPWGTDEAADLMRAPARTQVSMRQIVSDVRGASHAIVDASTEIATGSMDLSSRTEQTAPELQLTAASLEQITSTLGHSTANTQRAAALASENALAAERSGRVITDAVSTMTQINAASKRIGDIVGVIDGIAFQTHILALNAALVAQAGQQVQALVGGAVNELDRMTQQNAALVEQTAAASESLEQRAHDLVDVVARFRVEAESAA